MLVSVDLFRIRHVKVCTGRLGPRHPAAEDLQQHVHDSMSMLPHVPDLRSDNVGGGFVFSFGSYIISTQYTLTLVSSIDLAPVYVEFIYSLSRSIHIVESQCHL